MTITVEHLAYLAHMLANMGKGLLSSAHAQAVNFGGAALGAGRGLLPNGRTSEHVVYLADVLVNTGKGFWSSVQTAAPFYLLGGGVVGAIWNAVQKKMPLAMKLLIGGVGATILVEVLPLIVSAGTALVKQYVHG